MAVFSLSPDMLFCPNVIFEAMLPAYKTAGIITMTISITAAAVATELF
ncbi:MAG: hypothetical protein KIG62_06770 [Oscillospiraceae bacterium]|nr:hypothetical protein [Oscillospiraceae bacterium]